MADLISLFVTILTPALLSMSLSKMPISVTLMSHQVKTFEKVLNHTIYHFLHFNTSPTGSGKTPFMIKLAQKFNLRIVVVGPASIEENWTIDECGKYNMDCVFISYSKLSRADAITKYVEYDTEGNCKIGAAFKELLKSPIYLILDESQNTKNDDSNCTNACYKLMAATRQANNGSRGASLSATPMDKEEQVETAFKMMGVMTANDLFHYNLGRGEYTTIGYGYSQIVDFCRKIDPELTDELELDESDYKAKNFRHAVYEMYTQIIMPKYTFAMPRPTIKAKFIPSHTYYEIKDENEFDTIKVAISKMRVMSGYEDGGSLDPSIKMGMIGQLFGGVEYSKVKLFTRIAKQKLDADPKCKVVIYVWQDKLGTVDELLKNLEAYNPLRCDGKVNPKKRSVYKNLFNEHNCKHRVIIAKPSAFSEGHNLTDTSPNGEFKRHFLISPYYDFVKVHQSAGRGYRANTTSDVTCTLVYVDGTEESGIIDALSRKKTVTKDVVHKSDETTEENQIIYPGEYPVNYEN